jgi:hypothetical protein
MPKTSSLILLRTFSCIGLISISAIASAENFGPFAIVDSKPISELWINPGFYSYHFNKNMNLNDNNLGLGLEYRYSTRSSIEVGGYHNSDWKTSHYLGWNWQPLELGPVRLGGVIGVINGYPKELHGGWFPAALPQASFEYKNIGANIIYTPGYQNKLYSAFSFQLKVKIY